MRFIWSDYTRAVLGKAGARERRFGPGFGRANDARADPKALSSATHSRSCPSSKFQLHIPSPARYRYKMHAETTRSGRRAWETYSCVSTLKWNEITTYNPTRL